MSDSAPVTPEARIANIEREADAMIGLAKSLKAMVKELRAALIDKRS